MSIAKAITIVWIVGRNSGNDDVFSEASLSISTACSFNEFLNIVILVNPSDNNKAVNELQKLCTSAKWTILHLDHQKKMWLQRTLNCTTFMHHSTWHGYVKLLLPIIIRRDFLFVDTDTVFLKSPRLLWDQFKNFKNDTIFSATPFKKGSLGFRHRINSGALLVRPNLKNWRASLNNIVNSNRLHCELINWIIDRRRLPVCLSRDNRCELGDQEYFSAWVSIHGRCVDLYGHYADKMRSNNTIQQQKILWHYAGKPPKNVNI